MTPPVRILVVDDFEPWRRVISSVVQKQDGYVVAGEASDGLEAVHKAQEFQPDVILLDISLPSLSGMEAAKRIAKVAPRSKILVLSQDSSADVVREALDSGALGYVFKPRAQRELLLAIKSILAGRRFVGSGMKGLSTFRMYEAAAPHRHEVLFYSDDAVFVDRCAEFVADALLAGKVAIVVATKPHQEGLVKKFKTSRIDLEINAAAQRGTYIVLDSAETLSATTIGGTPDRTKLFGSVDRIIESAAKTGQGEPLRIAAFGECAPHLWADGRQQAAIQLERFCDEMAKTYRMDILCAYPLDAFRGEEDQGGLISVCTEHSASYFG